MKLLASIIKEIILLFRDKAGMATLFIMPAFLVIIITLIQDHVTATNVEVLFVNQDSGYAGGAFEKLLQESNTVQLTTRLDNETVTAERSKELVASGMYQFAVVIPKDLTERVDNLARRQVHSRLFETNEPDGSAEVPKIAIWFDPAVHGSFRAAVNAAVNRAIQVVQMQSILHHTFEQLPEKIANDLPPMAQSYMAAQRLTPEELLPDFSTGTPIISTHEQFASEMGFVTQPTAVQQNVPAWAIFGLFFIAVPLAGSLIHERETGTLGRLKILPVSYFTVIAGKLIAYCLIGTVQFSLIILAGIFVLPLLGLPAFQTGSHYLPISLLVLAIITAACGYGIFLGTIGKTYDQIALVGPISIVIGAAIGGIMVPVYALPNMLKPLCTLSPLYWGQSGFYDLLLREGGLITILPEASLLLLFGLIAMAFAVLVSTRQ